MNYISFYGIRAFNNLKALEMGSPLQDPIIRQCDIDQQTERSCKGDLYITLSWTS